VRDVVDRDEPDTYHFSLLVEEDLEDLTGDCSDALPHASLVLDDEVVLQVEKQTRECVDTTTLGNPENKTIIYLAQIQTRIQRKNVYINTTWGTSNHVYVEKNEYRYINTTWGTSNHVYVEKNEYRYINTMWGTSNHVYVDRPSDQNAVDINEVSDISFYSCSEYNVLCLSSTGDNISVTPC